MSAKYSLIVFIIVAILLTISSVVSINNKDSYTDSGKKYLGGNNR